MPEQCASRSGDEIGSSLPLRVLAAPASSRDGTAAIYLLYEAMDDLGVEVLAGFTAANVMCADICHLHFPEYAAVADNPLQRSVDVGAFLGKLVLLKLCGAKLIWTVHNLYPHDMPQRRSMRLFYSTLFRLLDGLIFLSQASRTLCYQQYPPARDLPAIVAPSVHFRSIYGADAGDAERVVPRDPSAFLFFGLIRPYKGLDQLIAAFRACQGEELRLVCAGAAFDAPSYVEHVSALAHQDSRINLRIGWVSRPDTVPLFRAAALVVLPYRDFLNSGVAMIAFSLDRPVLAPATPSSLELRQMVGSDWVMTYEGDLTPEVLQRALAWARDDRAGPPDLTAFDPDAIARSTLAFYRQVRQRDRSSAGPRAT